MERLLEISETGLQLDIPAQIGILQKQNKNLKNVIIWGTIIVIISLCSYSIYAYRKSKKEKLIKDNN